MKRTILYGVTALFLSISFAFAQSQDSVNERIEKTRKVIDKYVDTRQEIAKAKNEWKSYKEITRRRVDLYEREIESLESTISDAEDQTSQAEREIARIKDDISELRDANEIVEDALPEMEEMLRQMNKAFPKPLESKVERLVKSLGKGKTSDRMAVVIGIMNEVDKFNSNFNFDTDERQSPDGETRLVDVIYLGLGTAYYADKEGVIGGVGTPGDDGWEWEDKNDIAPTVRKAIQYYNGDIKPAMLVDLPVKVQKINDDN